MSNHTLKPALPPVPKSIPKPVPVKHIDNIGWAIDKLLECHKAGKIKGLMIQMLDKDGCFYNSRAGNLNYIEMLGLLESAKDDFRITREENIQ